MKLLSIILIIFGASYSFANHFNEAVWQAHGGDNVVNLGYSYQSVGFEDKVGVNANAFTVNTNRISLDYERGFNDMFSAGIGFDYISRSNGPGFSSAGFEHFNLFFKGNMALGFGGLHYGLTANIAPGDNETESDGANNASLGGMQFIPHLALVMGDRDMGYGLKLSYQYNGKATFSDESQTPTDEDEYEDGNIINAELFIEKGLNDKSLFGVGLTYSVWDYRTENDVEFGQKTNTLQLDLYGAVGCGCKSANLTFLPKLTYFMINGDQITNTTTGATKEVESTGGSYKVEFAVRKAF